MHIPHTHTCAKICSVFAALVFLLTNSIAFAILWSPISMREISTFSSDQSHFFGVQRVSGWDVWYPALETLYIILHSAQLQVCNLMPISCKRKLSGTWPGDTLQAQSPEISFLDHSCVCIVGYPFTYYIYVFTPISVRPIILTVAIILRIILAWLSQAWK